MSEENIYGRYHRDLPEPPAEPVQPAEEQLGGRFAAAAARAEPVETAANEQLGGRFAAAAPIAPAEEPEPAEDAAFAMEESAAVETLLPAEAEVLPAVQGEVLPAVPKKKMSKKTLFTLLGIVAAVVLAVVLVVGGVFRPSDEKLMEKYTALAAEGDYEGIDELLHKASKWERYQFVSDVLELEYEAGNVYDFSDLLELLPAERQLLDFDLWYEAYQDAFYNTPGEGLGDLDDFDDSDDTEDIVIGEYFTGFGDRMAVATSFGRVCDDFYRSGLLAREELIERCAAGEDRGDENLYGEYAALLGGSGAGKLLPVYCKSWGSTAFVDYGLLAALPQEIRASSYEEADYVLESYIDRSYDGSYRLGGTAYRVRLSVRIVDLDENVLYESSSVTGGASPDVIHYIGDAYGSEPEVADNIELVTDALREFMALQSIETGSVPADARLKKLCGTWEGDCVTDMDGDDSEYYALRVHIADDGTGSYCLDDEAEEHPFTLKMTDLNEDAFEADIMPEDMEGTWSIAASFGTDEDSGDRCLDGILYIFSESGEYEYSDYIALVLTEEE